MSRLLRLASASALAATSLLAGCVAREPDRPRVRLTFRQFQAVAELRPGRRPAVVAVTHQDMA